MAVPNDSVARGKIAIISGGLGRARAVAAVFQVVEDRCGRADCGNAGAAIGSALLAGTGGAIATFLLYGSGTEPVLVRATELFGRICQCWDVPSAPQIRHSALLGRRAVEVAGFFNEYTVIDVTDGAAVDDLLKTASPVARLAAVNLKANPPTVTFYTCGRRHPSAPLTGLAVLALLGRQVGWLSSMSATSSVAVNGMLEPLPSLDTYTAGIRIELPPTSVNLETLAPGKLAA